VIDTARFAQREIKLPAAEIGGGGSVPFAVLASGVQSGNFWMHPRSVKSRSSGLWLRVSVVVRYHPSPWRWRDHGPLKHWCPTTTLHGVTTQNTSTWNITAMKASRLAKWSIVKQKLSLCVRGLVAVRRCYAERDDDLRQVVVVGVTVVVAWFLSLYRR
jgi:hypothetical protein